MDVSIRTISDEKPAKTFVSMYKYTRVCMVCSRKYGIDGKPSDDNGRCPLCSRRRRGDGSRALKLKYTDDITLPSRGDSKDL